MNADELFDSWLNGNRSDVLTTLCAAPRALVLEFGQLLGQDEAFHLARRMREHKEARCEASFPWAKDPCPNAAEVTHDDRAVCWECRSELVEIDREARGREVA